MKFCHCVLVLLLAFPIAGVCKDKPRVPLPDVLINAKIIVLAGGPPDVLDKALDELNKWGRFQIVANQSQADLIFEFKYWQSPDSGLTTAHETFTVHDAKTKTSLYEDSRMVEPTGIMKILPKKSMARMMVKELRKRLETK